MAERPVEPAAATSAALTGATVAGGLMAVDPDVLFWALWGVLGGGSLMAVFAIREIRTYLGPGRTLSEVVEASIAARPVLYWTLGTAMTVLCLGWPLLFVHWYTSLL